MGFFDRLFGRKQRQQELPPPKTVQDPVFGRLEFDDESFWEGKVSFSPLDQEVDITVNAGPSGPEEWQRQWMRQIEAKFESFLPKIIDAVWEEVKDWPGGPEKGDLADEMELEGLHIVDNIDGKAGWTLTYYLDAIGHWPTIELAEWDIQYVMIDG